MANTYDLGRRTALVTGGAKGIGRAIVERLQAGGASVCVWDLRRCEVAGVRSDVVDITSREQIRAALARLLATTPHIQVLVNDAGYLGNAGSFEAHDADDWQRIVAINLVGMMQVTQALLPHLRAAAGGRIVNIGSLAGKEGLPGIAAYSAASGGVIAFTKALSREEVGHGILVNCVAPGPIDSDMIRDLGAPTVDRMIADSPMHRLGTPQEVADLVAWLCSDGCTFNTGAVFDMSGGRARY